VARVRFRLTTLIRLRQTVRDECRQELAVAQRLEQSIYKRIAKLDSEIIESRDQTGSTESGSIDIDRLRDMVRYQSLLAAERQAAQLELDSCSAHVGRLRQSLVETDQGLKSLEKLQARQQDRHRQRQRTRELGEFDEAGIRIAATGDSSS
jgi:flagellar export protein FliJ